VDSPETLASLERVRVDRAAVARFSGDYERAPAVYECILEWLDESGGRIVAPLRECYLRFGAAQRGYRLPSRFLARFRGRIRDGAAGTFRRGPARVLGDRDLRI
jgi:hypothetical protein